MAAPHKDQKLTKVTKPAGKIRNRRWEKPHSDMHLTHFRYTDEDEEFRCPVYGITCKQGKTCRHTIKGYKEKERKKKEYKKATTPQPSEWIEDIQLQDFPEPDGLGHPIWYSCG